MHESTDVRLARIEEGMIRLHDVSASNHKAVMAVIEPVSTAVKKHHDELTALKRDRWWVFSMGAMFFSTAAYALVEFLKK